MFRTLVFPLGAAALAMTVPLILALIFGEGGMIRPFALPAAAVLILGLPVALLARREPVRSGPNDGFMPVFLAWVFVCLLGAVPFYLSGAAPSPTDAVFESISGFTATGTTVFADVEALPRSLLFWRAMTQWLGSMAIVALTVSLLPLPGAGTVQMNTGPRLQAESSGPGKGRLFPRFAGPVKRLGAVYLALTVLQALLLAAGGMAWFDAVIHAFSTLSTGGFSSRNAGIAAYNSPWADWVCTAFMLLAGFNFSLLFRLLRGKWREVLTNSEARAYGCIFLISSAIVAGAILPRYPAAGTAVRQAFFQTAAVLSTTGFAAADHSFWPPLAGGMLFFLLFIGGCSGSAAGGIKVIRHVALVKQMGSEMKKILYPVGVFSIQMNGRPGGKEAVRGVAGFVFLYIACLFAAALLAASAGLDVPAALTTALISLGNAGPGLGDLGPFSGFFALPAYVKWGLAFTMLLGRLELWAALVFFSRDYWRR